jgi:hypothetical protein
VLLSHDNRDHFDQKAERSLPFITKSHAKQHLFDLKEKGGEFTVMIVVVVVDDDDSDEFYLGGRRGIRPKHMCTVVYVLQPGGVQARHCQSSAREEALHQRHSNVRPMM